MRIFGFGFDSAFRIRLIPHSLPAIAMCAGGKLVGTVADPTCVHGPRKTPCP